MTIEIDVAKFAVGAVLGSMIAVASYWRGRFAERRAQHLAEMERRAGVEYLTARQILSKSPAKPRPKEQPANPW